MGLLDVFNSDEGRMGLGLLAAGSARSDGAGFGQRLSEAVGSVDSWKQQKQKQKILDMQIAAVEAKAKQEQAQAAEAQRISSLMRNAGQPSLGMGGTGLVNDALPDDLRIGAQPALQVPGQIDYQSLIRQGVPLEQVKALAESRNFGRDKVARTAEVEGPNGAKMIQGFDDYGRPVGQGANGYVAPQLVNQGDKQTFVKPSAGASFAMGLSPSERDASARGWASNNLARERMAFDRAGGADGNKPQLVDGNWIYKPSAQFPQGRTVPVSGMPDKALNESQGAATNFGNRATQANDILKQLEANGGGQPGKIKRVLTAATPGLGMGLDESVGTMSNWTQSKDQQSAEQAQRNFITAVLRKESGASISPGEFSTAAQMYFPQPGDSREIVSQKQRTRQDAISGMAAQAGPGAKQFQKNNTGATGSWEAGSSVDSLVDKYRSK